MKQKYLALALSAIFATALTGCGSDNDSNYQPQLPPPTENPETPDPETPDGETPDGETPDVPGVDNDNPIDNPGDAAEDGNRAEKSSVVGQQYVRGNNSNFDRTAATNGVAGNDGNNTVVGFQTLQNKEMTNIVVAQYPDTTNMVNGKPSTVKYLLGAEPTTVAQTDVTNPNSIQLENDTDVTNTADDGVNGLVKVQQTSNPGEAPTYEVTGQESFVNGVSNRVTQTDTSLASNDVRVFGKLYNTADEAAAGYFNSTQYRTKDAKGNDIALSGIGADGEDFDVRELKLNNVQYGRVTGALDSLQKDELKGKSYIVADFANKDFNSTKDGNTSKNTDVYFYRGLNETTLGQMAALNNSGVYQYAGHALMYGIDNSYGGPTDDGNSNSVAFGVSGNAVGNFVQAQYDSGLQTVNGSIYNVWDKGAEDGKFEAVDLVKFNGNVIGNSVKGDSQLTYADSKGSFKGSFFGDKAQELGGALNSIDSATGYGDSKWGGVFGAQQITTPVAPPVGVPPINSVE